MRKYLSFLIILNTVLVWGQQKSISLDWNEKIKIQSNMGEVEVEVPKGYDYEINDKNQIQFTLVLSSDFNNIRNVTTTNIKSDPVPKGLYDKIKHLNFPNDFEFAFKNLKARIKSLSVLTYTPFFYKNGVLNKLSNFEVKGISARVQSITRNNQSIENSILQSGNWSKFYIEETGVFKLDKNFLEQLGISTTGLNPNHIRIFGNGGKMLPMINQAENQINFKEVPLKIIGGTDETFDDEDYVLFYGVGPKGNFNSENQTYINLFADQTYYFITVDKGDGLRIPNIVEPTGSPDKQINTFVDVQYFEEDDFNIFKVGRKWFARGFDLESQQEFPFHFPNLVTTQPAIINIRLATRASKQTFLEVSLNNTEQFTIPLPTISFNSESVFARETNRNEIINLPQDEITVQLDYNNLGNPLFNTFLDYISISATRNLAYANDLLFFSNGFQSSQTEIVEYQINSASSIQGIWDITDPYQIVSYNGAFGAETISYKYNGNSNTEFVAFSNSDIKSPQLNTADVAVQNQNIKGEIFLNENGNLEDVDYIIITPAIYLNEAHRLAQINRNQYGLHVKVVELQNIYNEFNTSNADISAIRNFVRYVYDNALSPDRKLKYVGVFGDGSYDYKNRISDSSTLFPPWLSLQSYVLTSSFLSDDFYGMMDEGEGSLDSSNHLDIAVGRLLANNVEQARDVVNKIEQYYNDASYGDWRNNVILVSDDVDELWEKTLQETTIELADSLNRQKPFFNVRKIVMDSYQQEVNSAGERYPQARRDMIDWIQQGALVANYFGHGGEDGLSHERLFDRIDGQNLNNLFKFNCFITITCEYTKYDDPDRETAGEQLFWNKKGGAASLITTVRQITVGVGQNINKILQEYLFGINGTKLSIADALRQTKTDFRVRGSSARRIVNFIGDPAMHLNIGKPNMELTHVNEEPIEGSTEVLQALEHVKLKGQISDNSGNVLLGYNGISDVTIFGTPINRQTLVNDVSYTPQEFTTLGEIIFKGQASVSNGVFEVEFVVPKDVPFEVGTGKVSLYGHTTGFTEDNTGVNENIQIGGINPEAAEDNTGPTIALFMNDKHFVNGGFTNESPVLIADFFDEHGINTAGGLGHDITVILDEDSQNPIILNQYYQADIDDFKNGELKYNFRELENGKHTLTLRVFDVYNNSSTTSLDFEVHNQNEELLVTNVLNYPNPFINYTEFWFSHNSSSPLDVQIQIFTISGKLVKTIEGQTNSSLASGSSLSRDFSWDGRDDFGSKIGKGVYIYKLNISSPLNNKKIEKIEKLVIL